MDTNVRAAPTVLIVEDECILRLVIAEYLRDEGYAVLEAETGEAALGVLHANESIDLVFTDIRLGGNLNGWDVAEAFRARYPGLPIIYTSGNMAMPPRNVKDSLFIAKPYLPEQVLRAYSAIQLLN